MDKSRILATITGAENQFLVLGSIKLCGYVLENGARVLTKDSVQKGMGYYGADNNWLYDFISYLDKYRPVDLTLLQEVKYDVLFQDNNSNAAAINKGINAQTLIDACKTIVKFKDEGFLFVSELKFARTAEEILRNFSEDYDALIDFSSGYDLYKYNHKCALTRVVDNKNPYYHWAITFPDSFYEALFQLKNWNWTDLRTLYASQYIHEITFSRLKKPLLEELTNSKPRIRHRKINSFQKYLEHPELQSIIQTVIICIRTSGNNEQVFLQLLETTLPTLNENAYESIEESKTAPIEAQFPQLTNVLKTILNNKKVNQ